MAAAYTISTETIKPAATSAQFSPLRLSPIDSVFHHSYFHSIFFYNNHDGTFSNTRLIETLKHSFSKILSAYYPLAGTFSASGTTVEFPEPPGILFQEAWINSCLDDILADHDNLVNTIRVFYPETDDGVCAVMAGVKATEFECGGIAIAVGFSHKLMDASSVGAFMGDWARVAKGGEISELKAPVFIGECDGIVATDVPLVFDVVSGLSLPQSLVTRRFVFGGDEIDRLIRSVMAEERGGDGCGDDGSEDVWLRRPTRIEVVVCVLYKCIADASRKSGIPRSKTLSIMMNMRKRITTQLPDNSIGNFALQHFIPISETDCSSLSSLLRTLQSSMMLINERLLSPSECMDRFSFSLKELAKKLNSEGFDTELLSTTSWCRLPFHDVDFGWGRPRWFSPPLRLAPGNGFVLWDSSDLRGIEVWITLKEQVMAKFECELVSFGASSP